MKINFPGSVSEYRGQELGDMVTKKEDKGFNPGVFIEYFCGGNS